VWSPCWTVSRSAGVCAAGAGAVAGALGGADGLVWAAATPTPSPATPNTPIVPRANLRFTSVIILLSPCGRPCRTTGLCAPAPDAELKQADGVFRSQLPVPVPLRSVETPFGA